MMAQVKILVHNINDVVNRAAFEAELNVYLKMSWSLKETHQAVSPETGFLMMTAVLEKDASTSSANEKESAEVSEQEAGKKEADASTSSATSKQSADKELTEDSEQEAVKEKEEKSEKNDTGEKEEKE